jgi:hypothetical protein
MARFFSLGDRKALFFRSAVGATGLLIAASSPVPAAPPAAGSTNAAPVAPVPPPKKMAGAPTAPPAPLPPPADYQAPYGKILEANNQPPYPFKLNLPPPGFGEVQVPNNEDLDKRGKLDLLTTLSDAEIRAQLEKWPAYSKMSLGDQGAFLMRIQQFRDFRQKVALIKARQLGLLTLNPQQQARFQKEYWQLELQTDRQLVQQLTPLVKAADQKMNEQLFRDFSSPGALAQNPPAAPKPSPPAAAH